MNADQRGDQLTDPVLAEVLADLRNETPDDVDLTGLRQSINEQAQLVLARRRVRASRSTVRRFAGLVAAAGIAFALWAGPELVTPFTTVDTPMAGEIAPQEELLAEALIGDLSEQEFRLLVTGRANPEELLAFAIADR